MQDILETIQTVKLLRDNVKYKLGLHMEEGAGDNGL
jgi:hypothetical protein